MSQAKQGFFAVDSRIWPKVCQLGMNEAVAYLVQTRGTGRDNRTTTWSVEAVERYTGISRHKAAAAVKNLKAKGFTRLLRGGTKPKYEVIPYADTMQTARRELSPLEQHVIDLVARGEKISKPKERQAAYRAVAKGWLIKDARGQFAIKTGPKPDLIWLPNALVGGADEVPPLELVRQTQDPMILRLLIDMYYAHNLRDEGGICRRTVWKRYDRVEVGQCGQFIIWGFRLSNEWVNWETRLTDPHRREELTDEEKTAGETSGVDFFRRTEQLKDLGLFEWVPHLVESAEESGEIIHPLGMGGSESIEDRLGRGAHEAGKALVTEAQYAWAVKNGIHPLVPVPRHIANVQMVGIARLRYRPHTRMTAAWRADLQANAEKHLARYAEISARQITSMVV